MNDGNTSQNIRTCARCGVRYDWRRSPSTSLKMTYCGSLCERGALGFTIEALLHQQRAPRGMVRLRGLGDTWLIAA